MTLIMATRLAAQLALQIFAIYRALAAEYMKGGEVELHLAGRMAAQLAVQLAVQLHWQPGTEKLMTLF